MAKQQAEQPTFDPADFLSPDSDPDNEAEFAGIREKLDALSAKGLRNDEDVVETDLADVPDTTPEVDEAADPTPEVDDETDGTEPDQSTDERPLGETDDEPVGDTDDSRTGDDESSSSETDEAAPKNKIRIPKERFDQEVARRRALEDQLAALQQRLPQQGEQGTPKARALELDVTEKAQAIFADMITEGDVEKSSAAFNELMRDTLGSVSNNLRQELQQEMRAQMSDMITSSRTSDSVQNVIDDLRMTYEVYDEQSESFDEALTNRTLAMQEALMNTEGLDPASALREAAQFTIKSMRPELMAPPVADNPAPAAQPAAKSSVARNLQKAGNQPPKPGAGKTSEGATEIDPMSLSEEDFENLSTEMLKKLRGDSVNG